MWVVGVGVFGRRWRSGARRRLEQQREGGGEEEVEARCSSRARGMQERENYWTM